MDNNNAPYIQAAGMKWMFEMELFQDPQRSKAMINTMKMNVLSVSPRIKECEFLIYKENRQMLVLLYLTWWGRKFHKKAIFTDTYEVLNSLLPTFKFRVTDDPNIMELAVERLKKVFNGGNDEVRNDVSNTVSKSTSDGVNSQSVATESSVSGATDGIQPDSQEQPKVEPSVRAPGSDSGSSEQS